MAMERFVVLEKSFIGGVIRRVGEVVAFDTAFMHPGKNVCPEGETLAQTAARRGPKPLTSVGIHDEDMTPPASAALPVKPVETAPVTPETKPASGKSA
jgi:hypothetical protein